MVWGRGVAEDETLGKVWVKFSHGACRGYPLVYYSCSSYQNKRLFLYQTQCLYKEIIYTQVLNIHINIKFVVSIINNYHITIAVICDCIPGAFDDTNNVIDLNISL